MRGGRRTWIWIWIALALGACESAPRRFTYARYRPSVALERWCRLGAGAYAFAPHPQVSPSLAGLACSAEPPGAQPTSVRPASTFAELVVEPGASIEIPVKLPGALRGTGCRIDSILIPHGPRASDIAIEIASAGGVVPIVSYEELPPPHDDSAVRRIVRDGPGARKAIWAPDGLPGVPHVVVADRDLWPTGAVLKLDGGRTADGAASVVFEIAREPEPPATGPSAPPAGASPSPAGAPASSDGPGSSDAPASSEGPASSGAPASSEGPASSDAPASSEGAPPPRDARLAELREALSRQPGPLELVAYRHRIDLPAPEAFSIVLRARARPFGIGVRSDREGSDPPLAHRAPGAAELTPTHLVAQVGVVVSHCGRPLAEVLRDIQ